MASSSEPTYTLGHQRGQIYNAHEMYHRQTEASPLNHDEIQYCFTWLNRSADVDHQIDAGWVAVAGAMQSKGAQTDMFWRHADKVWQRIENRHTKNDSDRSTKLIAGIARATLPAIIETTNGEAVDFSGYLKRLGAINRQLVELPKFTIANRVRGVGQELAVLIFLNQFAHTEYPDAHPSVWAWPSTSWQDRRSYGRGMQNYDIGWGVYPDPHLRLQVKTSFMQGLNANTVINTREADLQQRWQRYYEDVVMIFGDVHLHGDKQDRLRANKVIADPQPEAAKTRSVITTNIVDAMAETKL